MSYIPKDDPERTVAANIASMSLSRFLDSTAAKIEDGATSDQWTETSFRYHIKGLQDRYGDFSARCGVSPSRIFRTQEHHFLSYCQATDVLVRARETFMATRREIAATTYDDLINYGGNLDDLDLGKPLDRNPTGIVHFSPTAALLSEFADAVLLPFGTLAEIGKAWSLSTVRGKDRTCPYQEWVDVRVKPLLDALLVRAEKLAEYREEALFIKAYRDRKKTREAVDGSIAGGLHN